MFVLANPMPAVTAKTKVIAHTPQPAREMARCRACQSRAAQDGTTSAIRSAATPMARKSHPAISLDPRDRANQPFMVIPTPASASADAVNRMGPTRGRDCVTSTVGIGVTGATLSDSSKVVNSCAATGNTGRLAFLRFRYDLAAGVLARFGRG